jgi:hypothetical protein
LKNISNSIQSLKFEELTLTTTLSLTSLNLTHPQLNQKDQQQKIQHSLVLFLPSPPLLQPTSLAQSFNTSLTFPNSGGALTLIDFYFHVFTHLFLHLPNFVVAIFCKFWSLV